MPKTLPPRPNLDQLRRQAKDLLAALGSGDAQAAATFREHLPAARGMTPAQVRAAGFRLADAQSAIARKSGFDAWPRMARHIEQLRALEGTWAFDRLEIDGSPIPPEHLGHSRILIDGDRFRTESPEATYEGVFNIDVEATPHHIDIDFIAGPEAGRTNRGIFRLDGDQFELCLDMQGRNRPAAFKTTPGSGHACELLRRISAARPEAVTGGTPPPPTAPEPVDPADFRVVSSPILDRLQGVWTAESIVRDGQELPTMMRRFALREATGNEVRITAAGTVILHAAVRIDESKTPMHVDYLCIDGPHKGMVQRGIMEWRGADACFCTAAPGQPRPTEFQSPEGSGRTLSIWRPKK